MAVDTIDITVVLDFRPEVRATARQRLGRQVGIFSSKVEDLRLGALLRLAHANRFLANQTGDVA